MPGIALPGGVTLYGEGEVEGLCGGLGADGITLPGGIKMYGATPCDPIVATAVLYIDAARRGLGVNDGTAGAALDATGTFARLTSSSWAGEALVGLMTLDGGYDDTGPWFTDLDISATFAIPAHHENNPSGNWAEVYHIPFTGGGGATEWLEYAVVFRDDGDLWIGFDFESGSETGGPSWQSGQVFATGDPQPLGVIGDWHDGVAEATWRLTIVAATGAVTLRKDGVTVVTDTMGAVTFPEPPSGEDVQAGPFQYALLIKSVSLKDGIGGAEILGFDAGDTTGWTSGSGTAWLGEPLPNPFLYGGGFSGAGYVKVPDDPALDIAAGDDATLAFWFTTIHAADVDGEFYTYATRASGNLGANGNGFNLVDGLIAGFGVDFSGSLLGDGTDQAFVVDPGTHWDAGTHLAVLQINRTTDVATLYVDNWTTPFATADIAAVGVLDPAADLTLSSAAHHAVAKWDTLVSPATIAAAFGA